MPVRYAYRLPRPDLVVVAEPAPLHPLALSLGQRFGLLMLMRKNKLAGDIIGKLRERGIPYPSEFDLRDLRAAGLSSRADVGAYDRLTPAGIDAARECSYWMARELRIHFVDYDDKTSHWSARCTCGWSTSRHKGRNHALNDVMRDSGWHQDNVGVAYQNAAPHPVYKNLCEAK